MPVRPYTPSDWQALCVIHDAARRDELLAAGLLDAFLTLEQTAENEGLFDGEVLVDEEEGRVNGFVAWADGELTWLYVHPSAYRQGVGRRLLQQAVSRCNGTISTEVLVGNESALALYLSEGLRILKRVDGKLAGNEGFAASGYVLQRGTGAASALDVPMQASVRQERVGSLTMTPLLQQLRTLEVELHHPGVRCSRARLMQLLHPEFHEVGRSGRAYDRETVIRYLLEQTSQPVVVSDHFALAELAPGVALLTYRSAHVDPFQGLVRPTLRSSLWVRTAASWLLRYHQGTPAAPPEGRDA